MSFDLGFQGPGEVSLNRFPEGFVKSQKKVWELQHQTVCKIIGMAFNSEDLRRIGNRFGISQGDPFADHDFVLHSAVVHLCGSSNPVSRHIQKIVETKFTKYSRRLSAVDASALIECVTEGPRTLEMPLWAVLWHLATRGLANGADVETALFGFIHMLEHRLLMEFWESAPRKAEELAQETRAAEERAKLERQVLDLQTELQKSRKLVEHLRVQLAQMKATQNQSNAPMKSTTPVPAQRSDQSDKIMRLQVLLDQSRSHRQTLEEQSYQLRKEMEVLVRELSLVIRGESTNKKENPQSPCPLQQLLREKHVAMVGGIDSLECHYRNLVQEMGGTFQRHDGDCRGGECLIEDCIRKADLVVCPVEVNSHNAAKSVKKLCKSYGIPCCFPRTAGLSGFKVAIEEHFAQHQVA